MIQTAVELFGRIDGAFNNAGVGGVHTKTHEYSIEEFDKIVSDDVHSINECIYITIDGSKCTRSVPLYEIRDTADAQTRWKRLLHCEYKFSCRSHWIQVSSLKFFTFNGIS